MTRPQRAAVLERASPAAQVPVVPAVPPSPFSATVLDSRRYAPHFRVKRRARYLGRGAPAAPLVSLQTRQAAPDVDELFEVFGEQLLDRIGNFTSLNFMGSIRIFDKRASKHHDLLGKVVPRLREQLRSYEGLERSEMLVSLAPSTEAASDMDILMTQVPEIERRYVEVSLVRCIDNVWVFTPVKMLRQRLPGRVVEDLRGSGGAEIPS